MTAASADNSVAGPVDSLEVRWMVPGPLGTAMREWFARFPAGTQAWQDTYLLQPRLPGLSVKLRDGNALEVKSYLGSPGILGPAGRGRLEAWRKWSFRYDATGQNGAAGEGWLVVRKRRRRTWFPLASSQDLTPVAKPAVQTGCAVELTETDAGGGPWWTVGFEATGSADLLDSALQYAADLMFAQSLPPGVDFSLDNSWSYSQWLSSRSNAAG